MKQNHRETKPVRFHSYAGLALAAVVAAGVWQATDRPANQGERPSARAPERGLADVETVLREVQAANSRLRSAVAEATIGLPNVPDQVEVGPVTSLGAHAAVVGLAVPPRVDDERGVLGYVCIAAGPIENRPAAVADPAIEAGLYAVTLQGAHVELRDSAGNVAASIPALRDRPLEASGGMADEPAPLVRDGWAVAYLSIVRAVAKQAHRG